MLSTQFWTPIPDVASRPHKFSSLNGAGRLSSVRLVKRVSNAPRWSADSSALSICQYCHYQPSHCGQNEQTEIDFSASRETGDPSKTTVCINVTTIRSPPITIYDSNLPFHFSSAGSLYFSTRARGGTGTDRHTLAKVKHGGLLPPTSIAKRFHEILG